MSWVGGDIAGLIAVGQTLATVPAEMSQIAQALNSGVDKLADDASWSGEAAAGFRKAWGLSGIRLAGIEAVYEALGGALGELGQQLQDLENQLYNASVKAKADGAQIADDGHPLPLVITGDPTAEAAMKAVTAQQDYNDLYAEILHLAQGYRLAAATKIGGFCEQVSPDQPGAGVPWDKATTVAAYLKSLYLIPNARNADAAKALPGQIDAVRDKAKGTRQALREAKKVYDAKKLKLPKTNPARVAHDAVMGDLRRKENALQAAIEGFGERPFSKILNANIGDLTKMAYPASELAVLPKGLGFLREIPVVDIAAAGLIGHLQTVSDVEKGWAPDRAAKMDYGAQLTGVAAGTGAVAAAAALPFELPAAAVLAGAGLVAWSVGDFGYSATHEHWSEDIHDRGVISGLFHGTAHVFSETGTALKHDVTDVGDAIGGVARSLWGKVFG